MSKPVRCPFCRKSGKSCNMKLLDPEVINNIRNVCASNGIAPIDDREKFMPSLKVETNKDGMYILGVFHEYGAAEFEEDKEKALSLYGKAIKMGSSHAMNAVGEHYEDDGTFRGLIKAMQMYKQAIRLGNRDAMTNMALVYQKEIVGPFGHIKPDHGKAFELLQRAADLGESKAMYTLSVLHYDGDNDVKQDRKESIRLMKRSADLGNSSAMYRLAQEYEDGEELDIDYDKSAKWYIEASDHGHMNAKKHLVRCHCIDNQLQRRGLVNFVLPDNVGRHISNADITRICKELVVDGDVRSTVYWALMHRCGSIVDCNLTEVIKILGGIDVFRYGASRTLECECLMEMAKRGYDTDIWIDKLIQHLIYIEEHSKKTRNTSLRWYADDSGDGGDDEKSNEVDFDSWNLYEMIVDASQLEELVRKHASVAKSHQYRLECIMDRERTDNVIEFHCDRFCLIANELSVPFAVAKIINGY